MSTRRKLRPLKATVESRAASYFLVGGAGLSILNATPASGAVVYTSAKAIGEGQFGHEVTARIDLNHDGIIDFEIKDGLYSTFDGSGYVRQAFLYAQPTPGNELAAVHSHAVPPSARALSLGQEVGPNLKFSSLLHYGGARLARFVSVGFGPQSAVGEFYNQRNKFVALKLSLKGETYYGWARISTQEVGNKLSFELIDYAYQSTPNLPILAGQGIPKPATGSLDSTRTSPGINFLGAGSEEIRHPATLGLLAYGSEALPTWRPSNASTR